MSVIIGDVTNPWNAVVMASLILASAMAIHSELLRLVAHKIASASADAKDWAVAQGHVRWALRMSRSAHVLGLLAVVTQQTRIETIKEMAVRHGVADVVPISTANITGNSDESKNELRTAVESGSGESHAVVPEGAITTRTATGTTVTWIAGRSIGPVFGGGNQHGIGGGTTGSGIGGVSAGSRSVDTLSGITGSTIREF